MKASGSTFRDLLVGVVKAVQGMGRIQGQSLAAHLGVSAPTITRRLQAGVFSDDEALMSLDHLTGDDVLHGLAALLGYRVERVGPCGGSPLLAALEASQGVADVAHHIALAVHPSSDGGARITAAEARKALELIAHTETRLAGAKSALAENLTAVAAK